MELSRRTLTVSAPMQQTEAKNISTQVLDLKGDLDQIHILREAIIKSKLPEKQLGIFIPPAFLKEEPDAVYATAVRHLQLVSQLKVITVSGIHPNTMDMNVSHPDDPAVTLYQKLYNVKETSKDNSHPANFLFTSIEASNLRYKTGKWYFLTTEEKYASAVLYIDKYLPDIHYQSGFHHLEHSQKAPFT